MTVPEFLSSADDLEDIARRCGVHVSQVYRWRAGGTEPGGAELARLIQISDGAIRPEDVATPLVAPRRRGRSTKGAA